MGSVRVSHQALVLHWIFVSELSERKKNSRDNLLKRDLVLSREDKKCMNQACMQETASLARDGPSAVSEHISRTKTMLGSLFI